MAYASREGQGEGQGQRSTIAFVLLCANRSILFDPSSATSMISELTNNKHLPPKNQLHHCVHFVQKATNKKGESRKVSNKNLQDYMDRITKGWKGDRDKVFVGLWFALRADTSIYYRKNRFMLLNATCGAFSKSSCRKIGGIHVFNLLGRFFVNCTPFGYP